jgi:hypothetical protein
MASYVCKKNDMKSQTKTNIILKKQRLEEVKNRLNTEFVGIKPVIDAILDAISSWYLFPEIQEKPIIINLWGLTGVGKSSLVQRLAELIDFEKRYFRFDMGRISAGSGMVRSKLEEFTRLQNSPVIIGFDEFQFAKSKNEKGEEIDSAGIRVVWDLLDSGKFHVDLYSSELERLHYKIQKMKYLMHLGLKVKHGKVLTLKEKFIETMGLYERINKENNGSKTYDLSELPFIDPTDYRDLYDIAPGLFDNEYVIGDHLREKNGLETIQFLESLIQYNLGNRFVDCSSALIIVMGNLDELYAMSDDFNPDISADDFYNQSLKLNISDVKQVLTKRFRSEQIARLGNNHIIYPAFSKDSFLKLIDLELSRLANNYFQKLHLKIEFDDTIKELLYNEGVYPTQGTRPLFTTIENIIGSKIGRLYVEINTRELTQDKIVFKNKNNSLFVEFYDKEKLIFQYDEVLDLKLNLLRQNKKDNEQAITAVHEAGHAVLTIVLTNRVPEYIYSVTASNTSSGFTRVKNDINYMPKHMIIKRTAIFLGGRAAEQIVFGEENQTTGAEEDIYHATCFVMAMLKNCGMGTKLAKINVEGDFNTLSVFDPKHVINDEGEVLLKTAFTLARKTLQKEKQLLTKLAIYLSDNTTISKAQITELVKENAPSLYTKLENPQDHELNYREKLQALVYENLGAQALASEMAEY